MALLVAIFIGGGLGALSRFGLTRLLGVLAPAGFPYGTLACNLLGCFLFGVGWKLLSHLEPSSPLLGPAVLTGFLGALTTFSTYSFESLQAAEQGAWEYALLNIALNNIMGISMVWAGMIAAGVLSGGEFR